MDPNFLSLQPKNQTQSRGPTGSFPTRLGIVCVEWCWHFRSIRVLINLSSQSKNPNFGEREREREEQENSEKMVFLLFGRSKSVTRRSSKYLEEALYKRLFKDGSSEVSVRKQLNQFLKSQKRVYKWEVDDTLKKLRERNLYSPALKVFLLILSSQSNFCIFLELVTVH